MLKLYETRHRQILPIAGRNAELKVYCCGPTVYRDAHVGNLRTFLLSDLIWRVATYSGLTVTLIQNITDVGHMANDLEDKVLAQSKSESLDPFAIARKYEDRFLKDLNRLNITSASSYPRASENIDLMIASIEKLITQGFAYVGADGNVYFDAQSFPSYGAISGNRLDALKPGHRYEYTEDGAKRFHADWALWKLARDRSEMIWETPWGAGFPGWHIECSAMSLEYLGDVIDLHVGGIDLRFPHHENERAQSNALTGTEVVTHWVHGEHLLFEGRKMSKSAGNVVLLQDIIDRGIDPLAARLTFLENRYRSQMDLTWASLEAAHGTIKRWRGLVHAATSRLTPEMDQEFIDAIYTDLDTPRALQRLRIIEKSGSPEEKVKFFLAADQILGLDLSRPPVQRELSQAQIDLLKEREDARAKKDYAESDRLRKLLEASGLQIHDGPQGQSWS
ncbi:MAG: cysteine--tRNA ligase [Candidatus Planktophila sp.]